MADHSDWVSKSIRKIVKRFACPTCGAKPGHPCVNRNFFNSEDLDKPLLRKRRASYQNYVHRTRGAE